MTADSTVRILLLGPPAAGKSSLSALLAETYHDLIQQAVDDYVLAIIGPEAGPSPLPDSVIDAATRSLLAAAALDEGIVTIELPHHDYLALQSSGDLDLDAFDLVVILTASLSELLRRSASRTVHVPDRYIARSWGATEALVAWNAAQDERPAIYFDMEIFTPSTAVAVLLDVLREPVSQNLGKMAILPDPQRPYLGGHLKESVEWNSDLVKSIVDAHGVKTALDVGCGTGMTIELFDALGVRCWGLEGNRGVLDGPVQPKERLVLCDFTKHWIEWPVQVDLVWCVEVLEHVPAQFSENVVRTIARNAGGYAFVTAAQPGQPGYHHVNCRPKEDWQRVFADVGLFPWPGGDSLLNRLPDEGPFGRNYLKSNGMLLVRRELA